MLDQPPPQAMSAMRAPGLRRRASTSANRGQPLGAERAEEERAVRVGLRLEGVWAVGAPGNSDAAPVGLGDRWQPLGRTEGGTRERRHVREARAIGQHLLVLGRDRIAAARQPLHRRYRHRGVRPRPVAPATRARNARPRRRESRARRSLRAALRECAIQPEPVAEVDRHRLERRNVISNSRSANASRFASSNATGRTFRSAPGR